MVSLEAVMVVLDNSDYMRNGDYTPTRFAAQSDAVLRVCEVKCSRIENCLGLSCCAGDRVEVLLTPTDDQGRITAELAKAKIGGSSDVLRGIQTAQLALKHRQNKNQKQRIVVFVGSPITASEKELETLGKNLKKNNVSIDLVSFGEVEENKPKLEKLLNAVNSSDSSHLVEVEPGPKLISDIIISSPILSDGETMPAGGGGGDGFDFGVDANADPELALALRISMEEERARQQSSEGGGQQPAAETTPAPTEGVATQPGPTANVAVNPPTEPMATNADIMAAMDDDDMDEELRQALLLSMQESGPPETPAPTPTAQAPTTAEEKVTEQTEAPKDVEMTEAKATSEAPAVETAEGGLDNNLFQDPSFVAELLGSLPGVDISDPRIQEALKDVQNSGASNANTEDKPDGQK